MIKKKLHHHIIKDNRLESLEPIIKKYLAINEELAEEWIYVKDVPWWHTERANLSLFAGAVWLKGGTAFEEYSIEKKGIKKKYSGRNDLYFQFPKGKKDFFVEAKMEFLNTTSAIEKLINETKRDVKKIIYKEYYKEFIKLSIVFVIPRWRWKEKKRKIIEEKINELQKSIENIKDSDIKNSYIKDSAIGWTFPEKILDKAISNEKEEYCYPGVIIFINRIK